MPVIPSASLFHQLESRSGNATTSPTLQVICAFPVSGQYGPGSRVLYYCLTAACVLARKSAWLRRACLAGALLFPAVAALHGIVLAAVHVKGAADMDVYGAFQICSIGILTAPVTVRLSRTYFFEPGRNIIYLWTLLLLAGLLSLTVEFFRINAVSCTHDDSGAPISSRAGDFPYGITCNLTCSIENGPHSALRQGSANNIYVIPAPEKLTFDTATLLSAACCIPAILSLIFMWNKILEINWKANRVNEERLNEPISGTNGATMKKMEGVNGVVRMFLSAVEIPVFGAAVLAILVMGERNFFSTQVDYQTEPISSVGQWAPLVGTGLAILGSLYLLISSKLKSMEEEASPHEDKPEVSIDHCGDSGHIEHSPARPPSTTSDIRPSFSNGVRILSEKSPVVNAFYRRRIAKGLIAVTTYFGTAADKRFDDSEFKRGRADDFPEIPGEEHRNKALPRIREQYNKSRDRDGNVTPSIYEHSSRANSFRGSMVSVMPGTDFFEAPLSQSPESTHTASFTTPTMPSKPHLRTASADAISFEIEDPSPSAATGTKKPRQRRDTLEVPTARYNSRET